MRNQRGQIIIGAIVLLVILAILVPALINYTGNESKWTVKEQHMTRAFELAEAAEERGFQETIQSTTTWATIQAGTPITGYNLDMVYTDLPGGDYAVRISSGPDTEEATIVGVGRDSSNKEIRAVKVIYANTASNAAIYAMGGITLTSNPSVEWGPVIAPATITTSQTHPRFFSSGDIVGLDPNGPLPPNTDNVQWWSYDDNLPPPPQVDLQGYYNVANSAGTVLPGGTYSLGSVVGTYYFTGDTTLKPSSFIDGALIVIGNLTLQGNAAAGNPTANIPSKAWEEYGNDWATYTGTYDPGCPYATYAAALAAGYNPTGLTYPVSKAVVHGFMYVGNSFSITGGGNCAVIGSMYLGNPSSLSGSHVKIYYDSSTTIKTKNVTLMRQSWQELTTCGWSGTNPTCP